MEWPGVGPQDEFPVRHYDFATAPAVRDEEQAAQPLQRLPPSPFRSLGGYLDYHKWPDRQRFMELDEALRWKAGQRRLSAARSGNTDTVAPLRRCTARPNHGAWCGNWFAATDDYAGSKCLEHRNQMSRVA